MGKLTPKRRFFKVLFIYFIYCLHWVFYAGHGLSLTLVYGLLPVVTSLVAVRRLWASIAAAQGSAVAACRLYSMAQQLWHVDLVAPKHVESSQTRGWTRVPCSGRPILNCWTTREVPNKEINDYGSKTLELHFYFSLTSTLEQQPAHLQKPWLLVLMASACAGLRLAGEN